MGQSSGVGGLIAILALFLLIKKPTHGDPTLLSSETIRETFLTTGKQIRILETLRETLRFHTERGEYFRTVLEEHEEHIEEAEEAIAVGRSLYLQALGVQREVGVLGKMVQPTTTFDPTKLTQAELDKSQALALVSRPAAGMRHAQAVSN